MDKMDKAGFYVKILLTGSNRARLKDQFKGKSEGFLFHRTVGNPKDGLKALDSEINGHGRVIPDPRAKVRRGTDIFQTQKEG
jgi:hypothetical protein